MTLCQAQDLHSRFIERNAFLSCGIDDCIDGILLIQRANLGKFE